MDIFVLIGIIGGTCFAFSGLPQAIKSLREGHSDGISHGTVWLWLIGEACMLIYAIRFYTSDLVLIANYTANLVLIGIVAKYKYMKRKT